MGGGGAKQKGVTQKRVTQKGVTQKSDSAKKARQPETGNEWEMIASHKYPPKFFQACLVSGLVDGDTSHKQASDAMIHDDARLATR